MVKIENGVGTEELEETVNYVLNNCKLSLSNRIYFKFALCQNRIMDKIIFKLENRNKEVG